MLCVISSWNNYFVITWFVLTLITLPFLILFSGIIFYYLYVKTTFRKWQKKSNRNYPSPEYVREEILLMSKGIFTATFCPALCLHLGHGYCGINEQNYGWLYLLFSFFVVWLLTDFFEFFYHRLGHTVDLFWKAHRIHHHFYNPTPFGVISDDYLDQFVRPFPLIILPAIMPLNLDMLFSMVAIFFYGYGVYLHCGHELNYPDAHHPLLNTSYQHYLHHNVSVKNRPYHTGYFFKFWDQLFHSVYHRKKCSCVKCQCANGRRTYEQFLKVEKPDYSVLLKWNFWIRNEDKTF